MDDHTSSLVAWFYWFDVIETVLMAIEKSHTSILLVRCLYSFYSLGPLILFDVQRKEENRWIKRKSIRFQIAKSYASHGSGWRMIESRQREWSQRERERKESMKRLVRVKVTVRIEQEEEGVTRWINLIAADCPIGPICRVTRIKHDGLCVCVYCLIKTYFATLFHSDNILLFHKKKGFELTKRMNGFLKI